MCVMYGGGKVGSREENGNDGKEGKERRGKAKEKEGREEVGWRRE